MTAKKSDQNTPAQPDTPEPAPDSPPDPFAPVTWETIMQIGREAFGIQYDSNGCAIKSSWDWRRAYGS